MALHTCVGDTQGFGSLTKKAQILFPRSFPPKGEFGPITRGKITHTLSYRRSHFRGGVDYSGDQQGGGSISASCQGDTPGFPRQQNAYIAMLSSSPEVPAWHKGAPLGNAQMAVFAHYIFTPAGLGPHPTKESTYPLRRPSYSGNDSQ